MKKILLLISLTALTSFGATPTLERTIVTTSQYARDILVLETKEDWWNFLGLNGEWQPVPENVIVDEQQGVTLGGTFTGTFSGSGASLNQIPGSGIVQGSIPWDRLSGVIAAPDGTTTTWESDNATLMPVDEEHGWDHISYSQGFRFKGADDRNAFYMAFQRPNTSRDEGYLWWWPTHTAGSIQPYYGEFVWTAPSIAISGGWGDAGPLASFDNPYRDIQMGVGEFHKTRVRLQYEDACTVVGRNLGWSIPLAWTIYWKDGGGSRKNVTPAILGRALDNAGFSSLSFFANQHFHRDSIEEPLADAGYGGGMLIKPNGNPEVATGSPEMETVGWDFRGRLLQEQEAISAQNGNVQLDFSGAYAQVITLPATEAITLSSANWYGSLTNYERKVFLLKASGNPHTFTYPAGWNTDGSTPPASILINEMLRLELESFGNTESHVNVVSAKAYADHTFGWDPDAEDFFAPDRANISDGTQKAAVNYLVVKAKEHGWWNKCDIIYPFVGGNAASHSKNLKADTFNITWSAGGGLTHNEDGVTGDGAHYGNTGFNPSTAGGQYSLNSAHLSVYNATASLTADTSIIDGLVDRTHSAAIRIGAGGTWFVGGLHADYYDETCAAFKGDGDWRGLIGNTRLSSTETHNFYGATFDGDGNRTTRALPNVNLYILGRNSNGSADRFINANLRGATIGGGITQTEWNYMRQDWDAFNNMLGRKAP